MSIFAKLASDTAHCSCMGCEAQRGRVERVTSYGLPEDSFVRRVTTYRLEGDVMHVDEEVHMRPMLNVEVKVCV